MKDKAAYGLLGKTSQFSVLISEDFLQGIPYHIGKELMQMEWIKQMNEAVAYMETQLEGEVDYEAAAKIANCSVFHFQRIFSYLAGVPLSEYIRRRRMTKAAFDLQNDKGKVIEIALKYGYQSPTAFNRAFQSVHGIAPSEAKKEGVQLKAFQPITFRISVTGAEELEYKTVKKEAFRVIGISVPLERELERNFQNVPGLWARAAAEGIVPMLAERMEEPEGILGVSVCTGEDWRYYIAAASGSELPEGWEEYIIPAGTWAIFRGQGPMPDAIQDLERRAVTEWLPVSGYEYADLPDIERYLAPNPENAIFEVWLPVIEKK